VGGMQVKDSVILSWEIVSAHELKVNSNVVRVGVRRVRRWHGVEIDG